MTLKLSKLYYLLFVLIPFSQSVPLFSIGGRAVNIGQHTVLIAILIVLSLFFGNSKLKNINEPAAKALLFLMCWSLLTVFAMSLSAPSYAVSNSVVTWFRWVQFFPIFLLIVYGRCSRRDFKVIVRILIFIGGFIALWALYQSFFPSEFATKYFRGPVTFTQPLFRETTLAEVINPETGYYMGSANYNIAGTYSAIAALMSIPFVLKGYFIDGKNRATTLQWSFLLLLAAGVFVTTSRSSLLCLVIGSYLIFFNGSLKQLMKMVLLISSLIILTIIFFSEAGVISMVVETAIFLPEASVLVLDGFDYSQDMGFSANVYGAAKRFLTVLDAFSTFLANPIMGVGFFGYSYHSPEFGTAENFYLQLLAETGFFGLLFFIVFLYLISRYFNNVFSPGSFEYRYQIGFRAVFYGVLIANLTGTIFYDHRIWGIFLFLSAIQIRLAVDHKLKLLNDNTCVSAS